MKIKVLFALVIVLLACVSSNAIAQTKKPAARRATTQKPKVTAINPWTIYEDVDDYTMEKSYRLNYTDEKNGLMAHFFPKQNHISISKQQEQKYKIVDEDCGCNITFNITDSNTNDYKLVYVTDYYTKKIRY